ncbi:hypothetical protein [Celeribacter ethanolicus]|uniref:hypothetical protein n=1 Tax=Celeribacter ethanolicus TaxID=1758178 RepID=UPI0012DD482F|nr:hypothetical protein [Celeribacter ethanolicus]
MPIALAATEKPVCPEPFEEETLEALGMDALKLEAISPAPLRTPTSLAVLSFATL